MGLAGQNQVRHIYVGTSAGASADYSTLKSGNANELAILTSEGAAVQAGDSVKLFQKGADGVIISSDTINPKNLKSFKAHKSLPLANKSVEISGLTVDLSTLYTVTIEINQHGSLSQEDTYVKKASYKAVGSDAQEDIIAGLVASLNRNFSRELGASATSNPYFDFAASGTGTGAKLTITGKTQDSNFDADKHIKIVDSFSVDISCKTYPTVEVTQEAFSGVGTGHQVQEMEYFLLGERGDTYRTNGYPYNIVGPKLVADLSKSYNLIEISYFDEGRDEAKKSNKQLTIAVDANSATDVNELIADLNTAFGTSVASIS